MNFIYLAPIIKRHLEETTPLINQLTDDILFKEPVVSGRPLIEVILHVIRSLEYYSRGLSENFWEFAKYSKEEYNSSDIIRKLFQDVSQRVNNRIINLKPGTENEKLTFIREASKLEILQEMLEHSITHRGQIQVYFRLLGVEPSKINYII